MEELLRTSELFSLLIQSAPLLVVTFVIAKALKHLDDRLLRHKYQIEELRQNQVVFKQKREGLESRVKALEKEKDDLLLILNTWESCRKSDVGS